jgi:MSHA biogenesis protein MshN
MSLINKMLQDLDARGSQGGSALQPEIKPVAIPERRLPVKQVAIGAGVLVVAMAIAAVLWLKRPPVLPVTAAVPAPAPVVVAKVAVPIAVAAPVVTAQVPLTGEQLRQMAAPVKTAPAPAPAAVSVPVRGSTPAVAREPAVKVARVVRVPVEPLSAPPRVVPAAPVNGGRDMNDTQRAETQYSQALAALDDGRVTAAMELLTQALKLNPRHDAARQSLAALLIEAGRNDEAMQQLEQGLAADAGQPALAMLLARMQIERGKSGVATLLRTLPAAENNADYHAFLAGALQRDQRHKEAVAQYGAALRSAPDNGVWLMGLGISLQAEKRNAEALEAFRRARASGMLTAPLVQFVDRKIQQLAP